MSFKKNTAVIGFAVGLVSATDGSDITTGTPIGYYTLDGGTQTAIADITPVHEGNGLWTFDLTAAEMNGDIVGLTFTHTSAITQHFTIKTETKLISELQDLTAAQVNTECDTALLDYDGPTNAEMVARTLVAADYFDPAVDAVATVTDVTNQVTANMTAISGDTVAADNLELQYDGTGITGDMYPATQAQVGLIGASTGGGLSFEVATDNTGGAIKGASFVGSQIGTYANTEAEDATYHQITHSGNAIDIVYQMNVGGARRVSEFLLRGYLNSSNDTITVQMYDYVGADWEDRGTLAGQGGATNVTKTFKALSKHTGTSGSDKGVSLIRFICSAQTAPVLYVDELVASGSIISQSIGYANGAVWIDTVNGTAGTESFVNGTADNPVLTLADAITISTALGLSRYFVIGGSSITFAESHDDEVWDGTGWTLALGGQSVSNTLIFGADVSGVCTGASEPTFVGCTLNDITVPSCKFISSATDGISTGITLGTVAGEYTFDNCYSTVQAPSAPLITFGTGAQKVSLRHHSGGITAEGMIATQTLTMEGQGQFIEGTCTGGTVTLRGIKTVSGITNVTLNDDSTLGYEGGAVWFNDVGGEAGTANGIGSISRPSSVIADMRTIADSLNLKQIKYVAGSTLTLDQSYQNFNFLGTNALINFNGQDTSGSSYMKSGVTGTCTGAVLQVVDTCGVFGPCSMPPTNFLRTTFETGTFTCSATGRYTLHECLGTKNAGGSAPVIDVNGDGINPRTIHAGKWSGDIEFATITSTDVVLITGFGSITLAASCTGGTITIDGDFIVTDNSGGAVTIVRDEDTVSVSQIGTAGAGLTDLGGMSTAMKAEVNVEADTALVDYDPPTNAEMVARTLAAADYFDPATDTVADVTNVAVLTGHTPQTADHTASISSIKEVTDLGARAAAVTGTLSTTQMSTDLTEVTDDHYLGRLVTWTSGVLAGQQSDVTAYNGTTKVLTFTATTDAPANGDTFILS